MQVLCGLQVLFLLFNCQTPEEATENILNMFARTRDNGEFVQMIKKQRII